MDITSIPKVELHCHLDGIANRQMIAEISQDYPDYPIQPADFDGKEVNDYDSFWKWGEIVRPIRKQLSYYYPILEHYIAHLKRQNVHYFELMIGSSDIPKDITTAIDKLTVLREWVTQLENNEIQVEFLIACGRQNTVESFSARTKRLIALYEAGLICGIAIAGPEPGNPIQPFQGVLQCWHEAGLGIEIHAGEWVGYESIWDALNYGYPDRIGHGVSLFQDPKLIEIFKEKQIHIEMCPTSNLRTGSIDQIEDHPVQQARELGLNYSVNTDDPGIFRCSMDSEYELLTNTFGFNQDDFQKIYENSLNARFQKTLKYIPL